MRPRQVNPNGRNGTAEDSRDIGGLPTCLDAQEVGDSLIHRQGLLQYVQYIAELDGIGGVDRLGHEEVYPGVLVGNLGGRLAVQARISKGIADRCI
jgi:hypothetical protein